MPELTMACTEYQGNAGRSKLSNEKFKNRIFQ